MYTIHIDDSAPIKLLFYERRIYFMKLKNLFACFFAFSLVFTSLAAQEGKESPWTFSVSTDFAFYPKSDYIKGGTHFAPITGPYSGVEGRVTGSASYKINTPLGDHWLLNSANLVLKGNLELTPISVRPGLTATFTPLPFIVFSAGANAGTGWAIAGLRGMSIADSSLVSDGKYTNITPFTAYYLKWFAEGTFQFDTGALFPGDWTHFQIMYTYQIYSEYLTGTKSGDIWMWQASGNKVNGLSNYQQLILAYQIPWVLSRAGLVFELEGYFKDSVYNNSDFNGSFKQISISPMAQFTLGGHDVLSVLAGFSSRRSFATAHTESYQETSLKYAGYEWIFYRIALSWAHTF